MDAPPSTSHGSKSPLDDIRILPNQSIADRDYDHVFKMVLLGESGVGKTSLIRRFTEDTFNYDNISTIGVDWKCKFLEIDGKKLKITIWDTAGQEKYASVVNSFFRDVSGAMFVYDVSKRDTLGRVKKWIRKVEDDSEAEKMPKVLVGNKIDLPIGVHEVKQEEAEHFALNAENVNSAFFELVKQMLKARIAALEPEPKLSPEGKRNKKKKPEKTKKSCCG